MSLRFAAATGPADPGVIVEPPPPGVASGRWTVSRTTLTALGALVVTIGFVYFAVRVLVAKRKR